MIEACQALGLEWGYEPGCALFSAPHLIQSLAHQVGLGGNYLLNFGPKADGTLPADRVALARLVGQWVHRNRAAIYRTETLPVRPLPYKWGRGTPVLYATRRKNDVYLFLIEWPHINRFRFEGVRVQPARAVLTGHPGRLETVWSKGVLT